MHARLLSFLTDFEQALLADDPCPDEGTWETSRTVNYHRGLAQLILNVRTTTGVTPRGSVFLQGHILADGTPCVKAILGWHGSTQNRICSIYSKPDLNWKSEARKAAAEWMAGPPTVTPMLGADTSAPLAVAG